MAPKLTPDNLVLPDAYLADLDRNTLDEKIFPLSHHAGTLTLTPESHFKKYIPAPPLPSPYMDERFIADIRCQSRINFRRDMSYDARPNGDGVVEFKHYLAQ